MNRGNITLAFQMAEGRLQLDLLASRARRESSQGCVFGLAGLKVMANSIMLVNKWKGCVGVYVCLFPVDSYWLMTFVTIDLKNLH